MSEVRWRFTTIAHAGLALLGPVSDTSAGAMLAHIPTGGPRVLDVGCGKGEWLVRALERLGGTGLGIEPNPVFAADARVRAEARLGAGRVRIEEAEFAPELVGRERFPLVICTGSLHAFGNWEQALHGAASLVLPHGHALLGPGYWKRDPAREYLDVLGAPADEMHSLENTLASAGAVGWQVIAVRESTAAEWNAYEHAYAANVRAWCAANAADPDAPAFRDRIERWAIASARWGRDTMGYALVLLRR